MSYPDKVFLNKANFHPEPFHEHHSGDWCKETVSSGSEFDPAIFVSIKMIESEAGVSRND